MGGSGNTDKKTGLLLVFLSDRTCVDNTVGQPFFIFSIIPLVCCQIKKFTAEYDWKEDDPTVPPGSY